MQQIDQQPLLNGRCNQKKKNICLELIKLQMG